MTFGLGLFQAVCITPCAYAGNGERVHICR